ncbi:LOG family protein [Membranihabitans marinus]|uniref:LOG family protein n=1 Tax=Membranihabitans marinus TaxID=1227546 RepID=UPI001F3808BF|nr:TIGR00730 family Rossman fold protein [Membranihabitans marinus]
MDNNNNNNHLKPIHKTRKQWRVTKGENSWTLFKVIAEIVDGFETLNAIGPCVSIFGSARTQSDNKYYKAATEIAQKLVQEGFGVITGGGPGIMEAGNRGAHLEAGTSVGLNIELPFEASSNPYIDADKNLNHRYFFIRKVMFVKYAQAIVVLPGGFGTLDELFEVLTLIQTGKISKIPIVLYGSKYWTGLKAWVEEVVLGQENNINAEDLNLLPITDDTDEVVSIIRRFYDEEKEGTFEPNYEL